jgi:SNF2 family DNA or RNA helicase
MHLITWKNSSDICEKCGKLSSDAIHQPSLDDFHLFKSSVNEVEYLGKRLKGLVLVQFKSECLDLPDKIYRKIICVTPKSMLFTAKAIKNTAPRAITALTLLRELSDGFQYFETQSSEKMTCELCCGSGSMNEYPEEITVNPIPVKVVCSRCDGSGLTQKIIRDVKYVPTPKDDELIDLLEEFEESARVVIYAGFQASIDKIVETVRAQGWQFMRVDGRGWVNSMGLKEEEMLAKFQSDCEDRIAFIAHPESGGMGLTLTASQVCIFYSNDFKAENRIQAEDRIHRAGMDKNKGATIIDLINLKTDELVLDNLKAKREMQRLTMQELINKGE